MGARECGTTSTGWGVWTNWSAQSPAELAGAPRGVASTAWATSSGLRTSMLYKDTHHECLFLCDHNNERCAMCLRTVYRVQLKDHVGGMSMDHRPRTMLQQRQRIGLWSTRQIGHESDNDCALRAWAGSGTVEKDSAQSKILDECEISGAGILRCYLAATAPPFYAYEHVEGVPIYDSYVSQVSQVCLITQT